MDEKIQSKLLQALKQVEKENVLGALSAATSISHPYVSVLLSLAREASSIIDEKKLQSILYGLCYTRWEASWARKKHLPVEEQERFPVDLQT